MLWAIASAVSFVLLTGVVVVLARSRTARWERERERAVRRAKAARGGFHPTG